MTGTMLKGSERGRSGHHRLNGEACMRPPDSPLLSGGAVQVHLADAEQQHGHGLLVWPQREPLPVPALNPPRGG